MKRVMKDTGYFSLALRWNQVIMPFNFAVLYPKKIRSVIHDASLENILLKIFLFLCLFAEISQAEAVKNWKACYNLLCSLDSSGSVSFLSPSVTPED